jgi:hypothetical protein
MRRSSRGTAVVRIVKNLPRVLAFLAVLALPALAFAQAAWEREKGNCEVLFQTPDEAPLGDLRQCVGLWEAYRDVNAVDATKRQVAARAFQRVYREGDPEAKHLAKGALGRMGFVPEEKAAAADPNAGKRKKYRAHTATEADAKAAQEIRKKGMALFGKKDWRGALDEFNRALEKDPANSQILYDAACAYSRDGDRPNAVEYLMRLSDLGTPDALAKLKKARTDGDFEAMRDDPGFKRATGYAKIKVLNGMPQADQELGEDNVFKLVEMLHSPKLGYVVEEGGKDKHPRERPHVWFKDHSKIQAYVMVKLIGHPRTRLVPIDWDTPWDLIVSWADRVEIVDGEKVCKYSMSKNDPEKRLADAFKTKDDALAKPDEYLAKADEVLSQPQQTVDQAGALVDKAKGAVDKAGKAVDAVKDAGSKIKLW